jgi:hypothetical protein
MTSGGLLTRRVDVLPGLVAACLILCVYGGVAVSVDFSRSAMGIQSDEATYYMMGHSVAEDGDLTYRAEDLGRVWREFPAGPSGVFLKKGREHDVHLTSRWPFVHVVTKADPDTGRLFFGKSYIYPAVAAPFVVVFGTNGFLVLHAILLAAMLLAGYLFLNARSSPMISLLLSAGFLMASVAPAYFVWITPELFNLAMVILGYFCWLYKEVADPGSAPRGTRWLLRPGSDLLAALFLALATFSKPSNILLILPMLVWMAVRRRWRSAFVAGLVFATVGGALVAGNIAVTGEWNFMGGERRTFYGRYPLQPAQPTWESLGQGKVTDRVMTEVIFDKRVFGTVFGHNLVYFVVGRHSGLLPYFFPALFAVGAFLIARRTRRLWQWLILGVAVAEILLIIVWIPYNYFGGGGVLGNRYFMNTYGVFLFLLPPIESVALALVPWLVGGLFSGAIVLNAFSASFSPADHAKQGPLRLLPVELTLVNNLPLNTRPERARVWFGTQRRFQIYFLDDNAYAREGLFFWTRGTSRAEILVKTVEPASALQLVLTAGAVAETVTVSRGWWRESRKLQAGESTTLTVPLDAGFPYQGTRVWHVKIGCDAAFVPMFVDSSSTDNRYLGVQVTPELKD